MISFCNDFIESLRHELPTTFSRKVAAEHLKGAFTVSSLAVMDSKGTGPGGVRIGRVRVYERESFLAWLKNKIQSNTSHFEKKEIRP